MFEVRTLLNSNFVTCLAGNTTLGKMRVLSLLLPEESTWQENESKNKCKLLLLLLLQLP